jgi:hypothetical protein
MTKSKDDCVFYDKYFLDDLTNYSIESRPGGQCYIKYFDFNTKKNTEQPIIINPDLIALINSAYVDITKYTRFIDNIWYPIFVDLFNNKIKNKFLFKGSSANNLVLGVDQAITFNGQFNNWNISGSSKMCVDWIINSQLPSYLTEYGLLCWIKKCSYKDEERRKGGIPIDKIPVGAVVRYGGVLSYEEQIEDNKKKVVSINPMNYLVKLDNNTLQIFNNSESLYKPQTNQINPIQFNSFDFISRDKVFDINKFLDFRFPKTINETDDNYQKRIENIRNTNLIFRLRIDDPPNVPPPNFVIPDTIIYIPKGDTYSYYEDSETKSLLGSKLGLPSLTYISSTLYPEYREVINLLTIEYEKQKKSTLNQAQYRLIQKIAKFLCSHPLVDRTTISVLLSEKAQNIVTNFITGYLGKLTSETPPSPDQKQNSLPYPSVQEELIATKFALTRLSELFSELTEKSTSLSGAGILTTRIKNTKNLSGYCFNYSDLVKNLMSKYETYLNIDTPTTLIYKPGLKYGPHLKVNQNIISKANINSRNTILYNNFKADIGPYTIESAINTNQTYFSIKDTRSNTANSRLNIPLWDIKKKDLLNSKLVVTAGSDFVIQYGDVLIGTEISYPMTQRDLGDIEGEILENERLQILWSKISGPDCLRFSDDNLTIIRNEDGTASGRGDTNLRFEESTDPSPTLYIKSPGRYILRLKVVSSFGVFFDKVTVYVVDKKGEYEPGKRPAFLRGANLVEIKPTNGLVVICPNLREFAFGKQGIFWPIYSDFSIYSKDNNPYGTVASFGGSVKKYKLLENIISNDPCPLRLSYIPNNTTMQISRIILSHMMDNNPDCYNCASFFQNIVDNKGFTIDVNNTFTLENPETKTSVDIEYPQEISTDRTRVFSYGNHSAQTIGNLGVIIPFHPISGIPSSIGPERIAAIQQQGNVPLELIPSGILRDGILRNGGQLPSVTGLEIDTKNQIGSPTHLCHLKNVNNEIPIIFEKGCFHPGSGWLVDPVSKNKDHIPYRNNKDYFKFINKSSVINFTPERRKTFKLKGPGFFNLNNLSAERTNINEINEPNTYFSTIVVALEQEAQDTKINTLEAAVEQEAKEIDDHQRNVGYRNAEGLKASTQAINTDEFKVDLVVEPDGAVPSSEYCTASSIQDYRVTYSFPRKGSYLPKEMRRPAARFTRDISAAQIEDIEVEVEFMNYVNTKNLIMWLDVKPCSWISSRLYPRKSSDTAAGSSARDRWFHVPDNIYNSIYSKSYEQTKTQIDLTEEGPLKKYLQALFSMNDNPAPEEIRGAKDDELSSGDSAPTDTNLPKSSTYRIYLLNQEHIEGNRFNFSLKFTDNINKYIQPFDSNNISEYVDPTLIKSVEKDGVIHLLPTLSAFGYSDNDVNFFRQIIQSNNLHTLNNRFKKFAGMPLFWDNEGRAVGDTTEFTLGFDVINQSDTMEIIDNVTSLDTKNAIDRTIDSTRPSLMDNSICCWHLILHINNNGTQKYLPTDILGNIDYEKHEPSIYGYNFIASFDDKKYLLPPINLNAPYAATLDPDVCKYAKESLNRPKFETVPYNILPLIFIGSQATAVGAIAETESVDFQGDQLTRQIIDFFKDIRRAQQSQSFFNSLHIPGYSKYPFGGPDKVLISVSQDNAIWYKLEASIYKYSNCPVIEKRRLGYLKLNYKTAKGLSIFPFSRLDDIQKLINPDDIKIVSIPLENPQQIKTITQESLKRDKLILEQQEKPVVDAIEKLQEAINRTPNPTEAQIRQLAELNKRLSEIRLKISLYESTAYSIGVKLRKFNLVKIEKTITEEKTESSPEKGYNLDIEGFYLIQENPLPVLKILDLPGLFSVNKIINQLRKSSILDFNFNLIQNTDPETKEDKPLILQNKLIIMDGLRPFYFFDKNDNILTIRSVYDYLDELRNSGRSPAADAIEAEINRLKKQLEIAIESNNEIRIQQLEEAIWDKENILNRNTIVAKGYIYDGKSYKTIIELLSPIIGTSITIAPENSNTILVYDKKYATTEDKTKKPYNKWTHAETSNSVILKNKTQESEISTFGEGSYGTGSLVVDPKILPFKKTENRVKSLSEQVSIRNSFDAKQTSVSIFRDNGVKFIENNPIKIIGYNYTTDDNEFIKNNTPGIDASTNKIADFFSKSLSYTQYTDNMALINIKSDYFKDMTVPDSGEIIFSTDSSFKLPNSKLSPGDIALINARLKLLFAYKTLNPPPCTNVPNTDACLQAYWNSIKPELLYIEDLYFYIQNASYASEAIKQVKQKEASIRLQNLVSEAYAILYYCDIGEAVSANQIEQIKLLKNQLEIAIRQNNENGIKLLEKNIWNLEIPIFTPPVQDLILPVNKIVLSRQDDGPLVFTEQSYASNDYWINIDPEQGCSFDFTEMPKILLETRYTCERLNDFVSLNMQNICPVSMRNPDNNDTNIPNGIDENFKNEGNVFTYTPSKKELAAQFAKYKGVSWPASDGKGGYINARFHEVSREFFINAFGKERNQLVKSKETYLLPILPNLDELAASADGNLNNKVKDIFNLDNTKQIFVKFKRIPRKLRKYDPNYDRYVPNYLGELTKSLIPGPGGPFDTTLQFWYCIDYKTGQYVDLPRYFKWLNEMIYRAYYGSTDAVEHSGRNLSESRETFDWIPYDYL